MSIEVEQARFFKCIGEPTRLHILKRLAKNERCVGEIAEAIDKEQSLISYHLRALKECDIVVVRQEGKRIYYGLADPRLSELVVISESLIQELPLCQSKGVCYEEREDQECCES